MKKGMNEFGIEKGISREEEFRRLSSAGFDGVELNLDAPLECSEIAEIKALEKKYGLNVLSVVSNQLWQYHLTSNDPENRAAAKDIVKMLVTTGAELGADSILVVPGQVNENVSYRDAYENALTSLTELKPFIAEHKINVCVENVWNRIFLSPLEMRDFIDKVDCPYVRSYFDAGNVLINSYPEYWIEILGDRIKKVHIKDFKREIGNITGFVDLMEGDMDWGRLMGALRKIGYDDYITVEVPYFAADPELFAKKTSMILDSIFTK